MKKIIIFVVATIAVLTSIIIIVIMNTDKKGFYSLKGDNIKSITSVVGDRNLSNKEKTKNNTQIIKTYKYNNVKDPYTDLSLYIRELKKSSFVTTKDFDLNEKQGSIQLSRNSTKKGYIIIVDINYNKNSYTIKLTKGKGKIKKDAN